MFIKENLRTDITKTFGENPFSVYYSSHPQLILRLLENGLLPKVATNTHVPVSNITSKKWAALGPVVDG